DQFGRTLYKNDLGNIETNYSYDAAGRLINQISSRAGALALKSTWLNTGKVASQYKLTGDETTGTYQRERTYYGYDAAGNLISERRVDEGAVSGSAYSIEKSNMSATFDALGRMVTWAESGASSMPVMSKTILYDANGNIRKSTNLTPGINSSGNASGTVVTEENWFRYDMLNRVVTLNGKLQNGVIVRSVGGVDIFYDAAGQRQYTLTSFADVYAVREGDGEIGLTWQYYPFTNLRKETFGYDTAGRVTSVHIQEGHMDVSDPDNHFFVMPSGIGLLRSTMEYDLLGRQTRQIDHIPNDPVVPGTYDKKKTSNVTQTFVAYDEVTAYNAKGQVTSLTSIAKRDESSTLAKSIITYNYGTGTGYALGQVLTESTDTYRSNGTSPLSSTYDTTNFGWNDGAAPDTLTTNTYEWWDSAVLKTIVYKPDVSQGTQFTTTHTYSDIGSQAHLTSTYVGDGNARTITFTSNIAGQVVRREEDFVAPGNATIFQYWYRFGGKELAYAGNGAAGRQTSLLDYDSSITQRTKVEPNEYNAFSYMETPVAWGGTEQSLRPINSFSQGSASGGYKVQSGETLASIAANLWGDASLWYKLAEANGLSGQAGLSEGQSLRIPAGVIKNTHNASTFQPYDPAETIGDTSPTRPHPPKVNKCGGFGQFVLIVVAAIVAAYVAPWALGQVATTAGVGGATATAPATGLTAFFGGAEATAAGWAATAAAGATAGAAGSVASQGVGVAAGIQEKFSWNAVAQAAIAGGVSGGIAGKFGAGANPFQAALRGAAGNAATQGISMALGLQSKFDWAGVVSAGISTGVGRYASENSGIGYHLNEKTGLWVQNSGNPLTLGQNIAINTASSIAAVATRTAISGGSFGDNFRAEIPNIIGNIISTATINALRECFVAGTPVHTPDGLKPIETLRAGDYVWSRHDGFGASRVRARRIAQTFRTENRSTFVLRVKALGGSIETIRTTPAHPFAVVRSGVFVNAPAPANGAALAELDVLVWAEAQSLSPGDRLTSCEGDPLRVLSAMNDGETATVYN
ncbi:MAG TPA: LysM peptidoglycan-binding domain-containing protein, partial [Woeseiaceae bacterium]